MFNPNWKEITQSLETFGHILINIGLTLAFYVVFELCLLICSYLWKFSAVINRIIWANLKAPFVKKSTVKAPSEPKKPSPAPAQQPEHHEPSK